MENTQDTDTTDRPTARHWLMPPVDIGQHYLDDLDDLEHDIADHRREMDR